MRTLRDGVLVCALTLGCSFLTGSGAARASPPPRTPRLVQVEHTDAALCGMTTARYGTIGVGSNVTLGRHSPWTGPTGNPSSPFVTGDDNWNAQMDAFVGRRAVVVELGGLDSAGCTGVRVDIDAQEWFWRVRDLARGGGSSVLRN
jgi:hypothetical protein